MAVSCQDLYFHRHILWSFCAQWLDVRMHFSQGFYTSIKFKKDCIHFLVQISLCLKGTKIVNCDSSQNQNKPVVRPSKLVHYWIFNNLKTKMLAKMNDIWIKKRWFGVPLNGLTLVHFTSQDLDFQRHMPCFCVFNGLK